MDLLSAVSLSSALLAAGLQGSAPELAQPIWQNQAFQVSAIFLLFAVMVLVHFFRVRSLSKRLLELEQQVCEGTARIEALNHEKNLLIGSAAHDLRHPLRTLSLRARMLLEEIPEEAREVEHTRDDAGVILRTAERVMGLLNEVLDVTAIETGEFHLHRKRCSIVPLAESRVALFSRAARCKGIDLAVEKPGAAPDVFIDERRMTAVLDNLLSNAVKFTPEGGKIRVCWELSRDSLITKVEDTGPGIRAECLPHVFSGRPETGGKDDCGGLGLVIVKKVVEMHDGQVDVESRPGGGAIFWFSMPTVDVIADDTVAGCLG